jgi:hypothetical protein
VQQGCPLKGTVSRCGRGQAIVSLMNLGARFGLAHRVHPQPRCRVPAARSQSRRWIRIEPCAWPAFRTTLEHPRFSVLPPRGRQDGIRLSSDRLVSSSIRRTKDLERLAELQDLLNDAERERTCLSQDGEDTALHDEVIAKGRKEIQAISEKIKWPNRSTNGAV